MKKYHDMYELMSSEEEAKKYFYSLPDYVRSQMSTRVSHINSFESLRDYAENLLRGDD